MSSSLISQSHSSSPDNVDDEPPAAAGSSDEVSFRRPTTAFDEEYLDDGERVSVSLYYESLCPYCANFIVHKLVRLFTTDIGSIVNLRLIPWGNTQTTTNNAAWICQHGSDECLLNLVEACAISSWNNMEVQFRLVYCIERLHLENRHSEWESCFSGTGLSEAPVRDCLSNGVGTFLEEAYGAETANLNPTHRFVPWLVVNNQPLQEDYENFESYICRAYMGSRTPEACKQSLSSAVNMVKKTSSTPPRVCVRE
ncbi:unnamed protein product [Cuscuta campestris]|uniref:Gamma-interferon-inducible lysosomal thiol reductase n=1 Tax=Cuscuta campestris TaxID=132261 RepID=A0A484N858_9ASTE|nr:unnamed protein product [Cuscuta campestris]